MRRTRGLVAAIVIAIVGACMLPSVPAIRLALGSSVQAVNCAATRLTMQPGLYPPMDRGPGVVAHDSPRGHFTVSLSVYPGAMPLKTFPASPFPEVSADPYLHTGGAEYLSSHSLDDVLNWFDAHLPACRWRMVGSWEGNGRVFTLGHMFVSTTNINLTVEVSFGNARSGGTYLAYGVEDVILPARPASSYLHGPFALVRIAVQSGTVKRYGETPPTIHATVRAPSKIANLVRSINALRGHRTEYAVCN